MVVALGETQASTGTIDEYMSWPANAEVHLRDCAFEDLPTYLSCVVHNAKSCHSQFFLSCLAFFDSLKDLG